MLGLRWSTAIVEGPRRRSGLRMRTLFVSSVIFLIADGKEPSIIIGERFSEPTAEYEIYDRI
jgi:hypothetical protein